MAREPVERCFCCGKALPKTRKFVTCRDEQDVLVGPDCYSLIVAAGAAGHTTKGIGPRLFALQYDPKGPR